MKSSIVLVFLLIFSFEWMTVNAQANGTIKSIRDSTISFGMLQVDFLFSAPGEDLAKRFGNLAFLGATMGYKMRNNFYLEGGLRFIVGNTVKEPVAANVMTLYGNSANGYSGTAVGNDGRLSAVRMQARGFVAPVYVGKIFHFGKKMNPNSGFYTNLGGQFLQHKIWLEVPASNVPALDKTHRKYYDRLSNGFGIVEGFGFRYFSNRRMINFNIGIECSQNFTSSRRSLNVDTGVRDTATRLDLLWGFRAGWVVPIYQAAPDRRY